MGIPDTSFRTPKTFYLVEFKMMNINTGIIVRKFVLLLMKGVDNKQRQNNSHYIQSMSEQLGFSLFLSFSLTKGSLVKKILKTENVTF